jgi:hypothetical protein
LAAAPGCTFSGLLAMGWDYGFWDWFSWEWPTSNGKMRDDIIEAMKPFSLFWPSAICSINARC